MGIKETAGKTDTDDTSMYGGKQSMRRRGTMEKKKRKNVGHASSRWQNCRDRDALNGHKVKR